MSDNLLRWTLALLNALGVVGVGTYLAGQRKIGVIQMILSLASFFLTIIPLFMFYRSTVLDGEGLFSWYIGIFKGDRWAPESFFWLGWACLGSLFFLANWLWGWTTTRPVRKAPPPLPNGSHK